MKPTLLMKICRVYNGNHFLIFSLNPARDSIPFIPGGIDYAEKSVVVNGQDNLTWKQAELLDPQA